MPNQKAIEIAKKLGRPLPTTPAPAKKPVSKTTAPAKLTQSPIRSSTTTNIKSRPAFRPQAFKPPRGS